MLSRRRLLGLALGAGAWALTACVDGLRPTGSPTSRATVQPTPPMTQQPTASAAPRPEPQLADKVAAMLLVGFRGLAIEPGSTVARDLAERRLGGVVLFDRDQPSGGDVRNVASPEQLHALVASVQAAAGELPRLVAIDQEGGRVARLTPERGFPETTSPAELGRTGDPQVTGERAASIARTLAAAGINLNLAPVVDLDVNPSSPIIGALGRSFSDDPTAVVEHAGTFVQAHRDAGVATALKHFPGHGSATGDTHLGVVDVSATWSQRELQPFRALIGAGLADAVMTAHVFNATLDPDHPATLSRATITVLLRGELGFDGVVISDDLQMAAIRETYGFDDALRLAIEAGVDILTIANQQVYRADVVERVVELVVGLVEEGRLDPARIDESWRRIRDLRRGLAGAVAQET